MASFRAGVKSKSKASSAHAMRSSAICFPYRYRWQSWVDRTLISKRMRFKEELKPNRKRVTKRFTTPPSSLSYHSHLIDPGTGLAFLASNPQARTCPCSSYNRQVGTFLKVSIDPGQCRICCTFPAAIRDDPYAYKQFIITFTADDADTTYHARESSPYTKKKSVHVWRVLLREARRSPKSIETDIFPSSVGGAEVGMGGADD